MAKKLSPIWSTQLLVVKGKKGNRFKFRGFLFDSIYAGLFESAVLSFGVPVQVFRPVPVYRGKKRVGLAQVHIADYKIKYVGGHDDCSRLCRMNGDKEETINIQLQASQFNPGELIMITGHETPITLAYLKRHAER